MILDCLVIFIEMFTIALLNNCAMSLDKKVKFTRLTWAYVLLSTAYIMVFNIFVQYSVHVMWANCFSLGYCLIQTRSISKALYATACGIALMTIIEMILSVPNIFIHKYLIFDNSVVVLDIIALLFVFYFSSHLNVQEIFRKLYLLFNEKIYLIVLFMYIFLSFSYDIKAGNAFDLLDVFTFAIYFITIFYICHLLYQENVKNIKQKYENEHLGIYSQAYDTVLKNVRARQHEFDNHLNNIANMHIMYKDYDTLVKHQTEYVGALKKSYQYNKLLNSKQPVISGFLYMKFVKYEDVNAELQYNVEVENIVEYISVIELIEILGVLLDNAFQALETLADGVKRVLVIYVEEMDDTLYIQTANTIAEEMKYNELLHFFDEGYSTKGEGHGIGLYNVKSIVKRQRGDISIRSYYKKDSYWIDIGCQIKRRQEIS